MMTVRLNLVVTLTMQRQTVTKTMMSAAKMKMVPVIMIHPMLSMVVYADAVDGAHDDGEDDNDDSNDGDDDDDGDGVLGACGRACTRGPLNRYAYIYVVSKGEAVVITGVDIKMGYIPFTPKGIVLLKVATMHPGVHMFGKEEVVPHWKTLRFDTSVVSLPEESTAHSCLRWTGVTSWVRSPPFSAEELEDLVLSMEGHDPALRMWDWEPYADLERIILLSRKARILVASDAGTLLRPPQLSGGGGFVTAVGLRWCSCGTSIWRRINDEIKAMWADELEDDLVRLWLKRGRCTALMKYLTKAVKANQQEFSILLFDGEKHHMVQNEILAIMGELADVVARELPRSRTQDERVYAELIMSRELVVSPGVADLGHRQLDQLLASTPYYQRQPQYFMVFEASLGEDIRYEAQIRGAEARAPSDCPGSQVYCHIDLLAARELPAMDEDGLVDPSYCIDVGDKGALVAAEAKGKVLLEMATPVPFPPLLVKILDRDERKVLGVTAGDTFEEVGQCVVKPTAERSHVASADPNKRLDCNEQDYV
ncbi:hypothetical protein AK812_SmicGene13976 [Symbiodinium microadriaticum]|uniref:Uncharacterized protein n=1 Tax=Symbiodinium microadriaticum TaxID=2951 RepID=A0A1Q9E6Q2_SYMMI|nr:hypothetical protein AK812_SmicGene13976 [Symbiodinium microadriaticum]